jgi:drug/metabolite transporter (DMT)-like permease
MNAKDSKRALQPPFAAFLTKIAGGQTWDAAQNLRFRRRIFTFNAIFGCAYCLEGIGFLLNPRMRTMGIATVFVAAGMVALALYSLRVTQKASRSNPMSSR